MRFRSTHPTRSALLVALVVAASVFMGGGTASAALTPIGLGTATNFAIRAGDTVTNTDTSVLLKTMITGDVGLNPGSSYGAGLTCANMTAGSSIFTNAGGGPPCPAAPDPSLMTTAENDARTAFNFTSALTTGVIGLPVDLAGQNLGSGLYSFGADATNLSGTLTLNAQGDPHAVWIFQASSKLVTSSGSSVVFSNLPSGVTAAQLACNVFWTVGSSATLATTTNFIGTILASASIAVKTGATVTGRLLAANAAGRGGAVTLDTDTIIRPTCAVLPPGTGGPTTPAAPAAPAAPATPVASPPKFTG
jgi:Ice-binding-like